MDLIQFVNCNDIYEYIKSLSLIINIYTLNIDYISLFLTKLFLTLRQIGKHNE